MTAARAKIRKRKNCCMYISCHVEFPIQVFLLGGGEGKGEQRWVRWLPPAQSILPLQWQAGETEQEVERELGLERWWHPA